MTEFTQLETLAREICDSRNGAGHYDAKGTKRAVWRNKAAVMIALAEAMPTPTQDPASAATGRVGALAGILVSNRSRISGVEP